jgi:hypothetical protein
MSIVAWSRTLAAGGAVLAGWVAVDSLLGGGSASGPAGASQFLLLWGLPFAAAAAFLAWYALRGGRVETRNAARQGCLGGFVAGGSAFLLILASALVGPGDTLNGVVAGFVYAPIAGVIGLCIGLAVATMRKRRP